MLPKEWPFIPDHITNDGESNNKINDLNGNGIIPHNYLQGILTTIASRLKKPVTLMEFPPELEINPVRTKANYIEVERNPACKEFRKCSNGRLCNVAENSYANLFRNLNRSNLDSELKKRLLKDKFIQKHHNDPIGELKFKKNHHSYLDYNCPILGYRALAFPVFFENKVISILYIGEMCLISDLEFIKLKQEKNLTIYGKCIEKIALLHDKWIQDKKNIYTKKAFNELINKAIYEINHLENILYNEMKIQRKGFITHKVSDYNHMFYEELPKTESLVNIRLEELWKAVEKPINKLREDFKFEYICLFGVKKISKDLPKKLDNVVIAGNPPFPIGNNLNYDLTKIPKTALSRITFGRREPKLFLGLNNIHLNKNITFIRTFPAPFSPHSLIVTIAGYDNEKWNPFNEINKSSGKALEKSIHSFYRSISSTLSSLLAVTAKEDMKKALRIFGHEIGQLTSGIDWLRMTYLANIEKIRALTSEKADDINMDIEGYLRQVHFLAEQANMIISIPSIKKKHFLPFGELLFKWKDIYRLEAIEKNFQFVILYPKIYDPLRSPIYADQILLEQLLYNLVNNAVKYSHRGTKIKIDCKKTNRSSTSPHVLTIINYGIEINKGDIPYELYYRGPQITGKEGVGIGLFLARQIANAHYGSIEHKVEKISNFNIPLIEKYLESDFKGKEKNIELKLSDEIKKLKQTNEYYNIVALDKNWNLRYSNPKAKELVNSIRQKTWKVTFKVTIPSKEDLK